MMNDDDENGYGDPNHVDAHVDSSASKRRQYNKQYYASRKDVVVSQSVAEKRKIANKKYYERQKEIKKRILANGEGSSHSILATNNTEVNMPEINIEASERTPLKTLDARRIHKASPYLIGNNVQNMANSSGVTMASNKENIFPYEEIVRNHSTTSQPTQARSRLTHETLNGKDKRIHIERRILLPLFDEVMNEAPIGIAVIHGYCTWVNVDPPITDNITQEDPYSFVYEGIPGEHHVLPECCACPHCGAKRFKFEFPSFCCMGGKTKLVSQNIPEELYDLFTAQSELGKIFRNNIRAYNTNFSFTSMGVNLDERYSSLASSGVYTFRASGGIYHRIDQLVPRNGQPKYLQLYFYDPESELSHRCKWENLNEEIIKILIRVLAKNPYVRTFRSLLCDASPTTLSSVYVADSDPGEDLEEDPAEYHADRGEDEEEEDESSEDDDEEEEEEEASKDNEEEEAFKDEEEEHLALADSTLPAIDSVPLIEETRPFETDESAATPPPPRSPQTIVPFSQIGLRRVRKTVRPQPPMEASTEALIAEYDAAPTPPLPPLSLLSPWFEVGESSTAAAARQTGHTLARRVDYGFIDTLDASIRSSKGRVMTAIEEVNERVADLATTQRQDAHELYRDVSVLQRQRIDDADRLTSHIQHEHDRFRELAHTRDVERQDGPADAGSSC
ncbi:hypothetical protein Tco_0657151 [Tanacetum coccineum]|uniref:Helitron helicase-like domain-containing protein n=1 Tax=Tanacetum coccineum TaxID=301880 RepID=A0ABQ4XC36_9ASTR